MTRRRPVLDTLQLLAAGLLLVPALPAQTEGAAFGESIDVELVNVDVWVADSQGQPVTGLPQSAFKVTHDGRPVEVTHFVELGRRAEQQVGQGLDSATRQVPSAEPATEAAGGAAAGAGGENLDEREYLVLYFDQLRLHPSHYALVLRGLKDLLADRPVPPEQVLLLRQTSNLFVEARFGSTTGELLEALDSLRSVGAEGLQLEAELQQALAALRRSWQESKDLAGARGNALTFAPPDAGGGQNDGARGALGSSGSSLGPDACDLFLQRIGPNVDGWTRSQSQRVTLTLDHLSQAATFLSGLPGVKTVLYIGDGLDINPGAALADYVSGLCPTAEAAFATNAAGEQLSTAFLDMTRHLNSNRVTLYPFQTGGLQSSSSTSAAADGSAGAGDSFRAHGAFDHSRATSLRSGLEVIAAETGGLRLSREDQLATLGETLRSRYSLAYPLPEGDGTEHRIEVELADRSHEARYRRSFLRKDADQRLAELVQGALYLGLVDNPLGARLGAGELGPAGDERWLLPLRVIVPISQLTFLASPEGTDIAQLTVRVMVRNLDTGKLISEHKAFRVKRPQGATGQSISLPVDLEASAGPTGVAVGLRDEASRQVSVVSTALQVGPAS